jgi:hypothetical protein
MHFTVLVAVASAALGINAAAVERADHDVAEFHIYGKTGCAGKDRGSLVVLKSDVDKCSPLTDETIKSIYLDSLKDGCTCMYPAIS